MSQGTEYEFSESELDSVSTVSTVSVARNGSTVARGEGNTTLPPSQRKKRIAASKYWVFTYNNYKEAHLAPLARFLGEKGEYVFAREVGESGTHHLQGWVEFKFKTRPIESLCRSAAGCDWPKNIHWEKTRGSKEQCIKYCLKEKGEVFSNINYSIYKDYVVRNRMEGKEFYDWQKEILEEIKHDPCDRKIRWYVDLRGCGGKTTFCHYLTMFYGAMCFNGKSSDCFFGMASEKGKGKNIEIALFDYPRCLDMEKINYHSIELIKGAYFYSGKYESTMYYDNPKHVFVFSNQPPDENKMSQDRWVIKYINE